MECCTSTRTTVTAFQEKPSLTYRVSMGVYGIATEALRRYPVGRPFGFDDLVLDLLAIQRPPSSYAFDGFWLDIGRPDDYDQANETFHKLRRLLLPHEQATNVIDLPYNALGGGVVVDGEARHGARSVVG